MDPVPHTTCGRRCSRTRRRARTRRDRVGGPKDTALIEIESPMVGTFYAKPNPDAAPFVSVGTRVTPDTVVCLIEAMKIFNEIKAECAGTIERVLVDSGDPVEFGQPLFQVRSG